MNKVHKDIPKQAQTSSSKMLLAMAGIGAVCALLIAFVFETTLPRRESLKEEALQQAIFKVVPNGKKSIAFVLNDEGILAPLGDGEKGEVALYAAYDDNGVLQGVAIEATGQGYADLIKVLYGYSLEREAIVGHYVLESKETPGLGDRIEKDERFLTNFKMLSARLDASGKQLLHPIVTVKEGRKQQTWEIDGMTGATISSRAIGDILNKSCQQMLPLVQAQKEQIQNAYGNLN
ncbi:FMN-binding protein [Algivirga pacifica]|uniref:Ion-translocating oxidoreductase complex subunit G n=1 Tax=Algivirga pacifica TaxID=1162670 RepID=A0ABP9DIJ8_9BACT